MDMVGTKLDSTRKDYDIMVTTRQRMLDRVVSKVEALRLNNNIPLIDISEDDGVIESEQSLLADQNDNESL